MTRPASKTLSSIAEVKTGITFTRTSQEPYGQDVRAIRLSDFTPDGKLDLDLAAKVADTDNTTKHRLESGDVLIRSRGSKFLAAVFHDDAVPTIAANPIIIVRLNAKLLTPAYFRWFFNSDPTAQRQLLRNMQGTTIPFLRRSDVAELDIPVPSIGVQKRIVDMAELAKDADVLACRIAVLRSQLSNAVLGKVARGELKETPCQ